MSFPILKYLALQTAPVTAYKLEREDLDVMRDGKIRKAQIDKPTIYDSLKLMEDHKQVELKDRKVCDDGRVRKKYLVTPRGVLVLLGYGVRDGYVEISSRYVHELAEKQKSLFPRIFDLWPEFVQEKAEDIACRKLIDVCQLTVPSEFEYVEGNFFSCILADLKDPDEPDNKRWLEVVSRNGRIRMALVEITADGLARGVEDNVATLRLLLNWKTEWLESQSSGKLRQAVLHMISIVTEQYPPEDAKQARMSKLLE